MYNSLRCIPGFSSFPGKFQKLQNNAIRKILEAFKTSPIMTMELKAAISPLKVKFNKICQNYALKILQMPENHSIRLRVSSSFPPYSSGTELDWEKFKDWNEKNQNNSEIAKISSNSEDNMQRHRRKRRK